ncbi:uncharacterized protein LOC125684411 [Lagopus muta]|uniref:uncharacterized protein LOC125684411 n=1 Tax=Lagopus muta TaxID=64668 RepID=UPI00209E9580|nr:uncharacterized protein LOC125684411 [Lagopus muta]
MYAHWSAPVSDSRTEDKRQNSKPDALYSRPPVPALLPAFFGLLGQRHQLSSLRDPGLWWSSVCRAPGQKHTTHSRCRVSGFAAEPGTANRPGLRNASLLDPSLFVSPSSRLAEVAAVAVSRAQVQQEPAAETREGTGINITCSHPNIQSNDYIQWYRQLPGRGPAFLVNAFKGSKEVPDPEGQLWVSADRRSSVLRLARPRLGDAALYYCAVGARKRSRGCGRAQTAWGGAGAQCRLGPQGALPAWPPNSILTGVRSPEFSTETRLHP